MNLKNIGKNVKQIRRSRHLTQEKLAEAIDISTVHMSHIETGSVCMSLDCLLYLCTVLGTTPNDILLGEFDPPVEGQVRMSDEKIKRLTADELLFISRVADLLNEIKLNR